MLSHYNPNHHVQVRLDEDLNDMQWRPCLTLTFPAEQVSVVGASLCHTCLVTQCLSLAAFHAPRFTHPITHGPHPHLTSGYRSNRCAVRDKHDECYAAASAHASRVAAAGASVDDEVIIIIPIPAKFSVSFAFCAAVVGVCRCRAAPEN